VVAFKTGQSEETFRKIEGPVGRGAILGMRDTGFLLGCIIWYVNYSSVKLLKNNQGII